jgi:hypothetical protein
LTPAGQVGSATHQKEYRGLEMFLARQKNNHKI